MIPNPACIRATRRWAFGEAGIIASLFGMVILAINRSWIGITVAVLVSASVALIIYWSETRLLRRRLAVLQQPFPASWESILLQRVPYYASLIGSERLRFQQLVQLFLSEKPIYGIGCKVDDVTRLLVAVSAVIPIFGFPNWEYTTLRKILLRPEAFDAEFREGNAMPRLAEGMVGASGLFNGIMILSQPELLAGFNVGAGKHHVGIHEFAHLIDQSNGAIDGIPDGIPRTCLQPWTTLIREHLSQHSKRESGIPAYGYTNEAEFFAVVSEYYFQSPDELARRDPALYALLNRIFRQDMLSHAQLMRRLPNRSPDASMHGVDSA